MHSLTDLLTEPLAGVLAVPNECTLATKLTAVRYLPQPQTNAAHFLMHQIVITTTAANAAAISITIST